MSLQRRKFLFVAAPGFSGTTLLSGVMGQHPAIATVGEMTGLISRVDPETYLCSCGERIRECAFWLRIAEQMALRGERFSTDDFKLKFFIGRRRPAQVLLSRSLHNSTLNRMRDRITGRMDSVVSERRRIARRNLAFVDSLREVTGRDVVLDVSKDPIRMHYLAGMPELDLFVVHFIRDARGNAWSFSKNRGETIRAGAKHWAWVHRDIERFRRDLPEGRYLRVRYEDFCADPVGQAARIQAFCDLPPHDVAPVVDPARMHLVGNSMRTRGAAEIRLDERWRERLSQEDQRSILRIAGRLNRQFGYGGT